MSEAVSRIEVRIDTICDGWINAWGIEDKAGIRTPQTFATVDEAKDEILSFIADQQAEVTAGERDADDVDSEDCFAIVEVLPDGTEISHG